MGTRQHKWRATNTVYVDIKTGSDLTGDGSQYKPYQSYTRALYHNQPTAEIPTSIPTITLAPGVYTGQLSFGCVGSIVGTQWGAVIIDLKNMYTDYGFYHSNIIVMNGVPATDTTPIGNWTNRDYRFAGVGSATTRASWAPVTTCSAFPVRLSLYTTVLCIGVVYGQTPARIVSTHA